MTWAIDTDQLRSTEIGLRGKLRSAQISEGFIDRNVEDLLQQAVAEYATARENGVKVTNPAGWIVHTAYRRAIDLLRREQHETGGNSEDVAADIPDETTPLPEEEALGHIEAEQLHRAISRLSVPQRQALSLYYFEDRTTRSAADALGWSEPTFRRRRDSAIKSLRERFGVSVPEIDIGLAAWLSLTTAETRFGWITATANAAIETIRSGAAAAVDRTRDLTTRLLSSGGGETAIGIGSPAGKAAAGVCATAIAACTATGVIGPGLAGVDLVGRDTDSQPAVEKRLEPEPAQARATPVTSTPSRTELRPGSAGKTRTTKQDKTIQSSTVAGSAKQANQDAGSQFGVESTASASPAPSVSSTPSTSAPSAPAPSPSPDQAAQQQFGLP